MIKTKPFILLLTTNFLLICACSNKSDHSSSDRMVMPSLAKAPDFEVTTIAGQEVSLQSSLNEGKPMVIYFTASWCPKCAKNWPELSKVYPEYKDKLNFVAVSIDPTDTEEVMKNLSEEKGFTFPVTSGHPEIMVDFGVENQATTLGINREGYITFQKSYTTLSADEFRTLFNELIN